MTTARHDIPLCRGVYVVSTAMRTRGDLLSIEVGDGGAPPRGRRGKKCWEVVEGRTSRCPGCPAFELAPGAEQTAVLEKPDGPFIVVHARRGRSTVRVALISIPDSVLVDLVRGKLDRLMGAAGLSEKERAVLDLLLLGRQTREIATALAITSRTVKFHVTNLLEKLAADSRLDLVRKLMLTAEVVPTR